MSNSNQYGPNPGDGGAWGAAPNGGWSQGQHGSSPDGAYGGATGGGQSTTYGGGQHGGGAYGGYAPGDTSAASAPGGGSYGGGPYGGSYGGGTYGGDAGGPASSGISAGGTYGGAPYAFASASPQGDGPTPKRSRRGAVLAIVAATAVVLLGLGTWGGIALFGVFAGARSAQGATEKFLSSVATFDVMGAALALAPSEAAMFKDAAEHLLSDDFGRPPTSSAIPSLKEGLDHATAALDVEFEDLEYSTEKVVDEVELVTIESGTMIFDGDEAELRTALAEIGAALTYEQELASGASEEEAAAAANEAFKDEPVNVDLPYRYDIEQGGPDGEAALPGGLQFVSVHEGSGWYVSGIMTAAQIITKLGMGLSGSSDAFPELPANHLAEQAGAPTPEDAGLVLVESVGEYLGSPTQSTMDAVAGAFITPERRLLSLYLLPLAQHSLEGASPSNATFTVTGGGFRTVTAHGETMILPDKLELANGASSTLTLDGYCQSVDTSPPDCLTDWKGFSALGLDELGLVVKQEEGGWVVSVMQTIGLATKVAADNYIRLRDEGRLDELEQ